MSQSVRVRLDDALSRRLPAVCVMTGAPASGYVPVDAGHGALAASVRFAVSRSRARYRVMLPMSRAAFDRWYGLRARRIWLSFIGLLGVLVAAATRWVGPISLVILALSVMSLAAAAVAHVRAPWSQPSATVDARGQWVTLSGVHPAFVESALHQRG